MEEMQVPWAITGPEIKKQGLASMYNSNKNTALVVARLFDIKENELPKCWVGSVPEGIFRSE
jgi:hypothetical protein